MTLQVKQQQELRGTESRLSGERACGASCYQGKRFSFLFLGPRVPEDTIQWIRSLGCHELVSEFTYLNFDSFHTLW